MNERDPAQESVVDGGHSVDRDSEDQREPDRSSVDAIDAGPVPPGLLDEIEDLVVDSMATLATSSEMRSDVDAIDAGPVPAGLLDEVEAVEDD